MKIFILFYNGTDDFSSLPKDAEIVPIFRLIKGAPNVRHIRERLESVLDKADLEHDFILFKGPSYLCAIAGYVWFTQAARTHSNFFGFNKRTNSYEAHVTPIDELESTNV